MPIFQPSMMKSSSSRAWGGGDVGSQTPRCSATLISVSTEMCVKCHVLTSTSTFTSTSTSTSTSPSHRRFMDKHDRRIPSSAPPTNTPHLPHTHTLSTQPKPTQPTPPHPTPPKLKPPPSERKKNEKKRKKPTPNLLQVQRVKKGVTAPSPAPLPKTPN